MRNWQDCIRRPPCYDRADRTIALSPDKSGGQDLAVGEIARGTWLVQLRWSAAGRDYYLEQPVALQ